MYPDAACSLCILNILKDLFLSPHRVRTIYVVITFHFLFIDVSLRNQTLNNVPRHLRSFAPAKFTFSDFQFVISKYLIVKVNCPLLSTDILAFTVCFELLYNYFQWCPVTFIKLKICLLNETFDWVHHAVNAIVLFPNLMGQEFCGP